jgi:hypothetical protein
VVLIGELSTQGTNAVTDIGVLVIKTRFEHHSSFASSKSDLFNQP